MQPRPIIPGRTYMLTRRTTQRMFLLRPSPKINACIRYCLALAQRRAGLLVHAIIFLSNHYHIIVTDKDGTLPEFTEELNKLLARSLNCLHGRWEGFWSSGVQVSHVSLESAEDVLAKTVYALANPTEAMLVSHGDKWPGVRLFRKGKYLAKKPDFFFRSEKEGGLPDRLDLILTPPPIGLASERTDKVVQAAVSSREKELRDEAHFEGRRFMGAAVVKQQHIYDSPAGPAPRRKLSPRVACRDKWRRVEVLKRLAEFVQEHEQKRKAFLAGARNVLFPHGTYQIVKQFGARCAEH